MKRRVAAIYTQAEVGAMIAAPKHISPEGWNERWEGRSPAIYEMDTRIRADADDPDSGMSFYIASCSRPQRGEWSFTLVGELAGRPEHPLCRFDIQTGRHTNPRWHPPPQIPRRVIHRHVYNERAIRDGQPWDKCADLVLDPSMGARQDVALLTRMFIDGVNLTIQDPDTYSLFQRM